MNTCTTLLGWTTALMNSKLVVPTWAPRFAFCNSATVVAVSDAHAASSNTAATAEIAGTNRLRMLIASPLLGSRPYPEGAPILT